MFTTVWFISSAFENVLLFIFRLGVCLTLPKYQQVLGKYVLEAPKLRGGEILFCEELVC